MRKSRSLPLLLTALVLAACQAAPLQPATGTPKPPKPAGTAKPVQAIATLTGKVKLLADARTGMVSDHGGGLIGDAGVGMVSDHGGGVISNNTGGIIANNGGAVIANNSGNVIANNGGNYRLAQAGSLAAFALADAEVGFFDAAGKPLPGPDGQPLKARTDGTGAYALAAALPTRNFVARVTLKGGGELRALVVPGDGSALQADLDTASTIGAAYVLDQLVKGDQAVFDRLPRAEAQRLAQELAAFPGFLVAAPTYRAEAMAQAAEALATRVPAVEQAIGEVKALLLGQARLGEGRPGTQVALGGPLSVALDADGSLLIGEGFVGRVRKLAAAGTITTYVDAGAGQIKANFVRLCDMARGPDGTLWAVTKSSGPYRVTPAGAVERLSTGAWAPGGVELVTTEAVACAPDGTVYVGEFTYGAGSAPRLLAVKGDVATRLMVDAAWDGGRVSGLAVAPDGSLLVAYDDDRTGGALYRWRDGAATKLLTFATADERPTDLAGAGGTAYVLQAGARRVLAVALDGTTTTVPLDAAVLQPNAIAAGPDGTLWVSDMGTSQVFRRTPAGAWAAVAGADGVVDATGATTDFAINQPTGLAFDDQGALYVAEAGSSRVRRFRDGKLATFAGSTAGSGGDGGPAAQAQLNTPTGLAFAGGELLIAEAVGRRVRAVAPDGTIRTLFGGGTGIYGDDRLDPGTPLPAAGRYLPELNGLAAAADGRIYATTISNHQLLRYTPATAAGPALIESIAGRYRPDDPSVYAPSAYMENDETDPKGVLGFPLGLAVDPQGRPVVAEMVAARVLRAEAGGPLTRIAGRKMADMMAIGGTLAGTGQTSDPDGVPATDSTLVFPTAVVYAKDGSAYVAEAGTIHFGALGAIGNVGGAAGTFLGIAIDALAMPRTAGRVRRIAPDGTITTVAGRGTKFFPADAGDDALILPVALAIAPDGRLAIGDMGANMIRILPAGSY